MSIDITESENDEEFSETISLMDNMDQEKKGKIDLIIGLIIILSLSILLIIFSINSGYYDYSFAVSIQNFLQTSEQLRNLDNMLQYSNYFGYGIMIFSAVFVILYYIPNTSLKVKPLVKYFGLILLTGLIGAIGINILLKLVNRPIPSSVNNFSEFLPFYQASNNVSNFIYSSLPNGNVILAGVMIAIPLCFNRPNRKILLWISAILVTIFLILLSIIEIGQMRAWPSDVVISILIDTLISYFIYSKILFIKEQEEDDIKERVVKPQKEAYLTILKARSLLDEDPNEAIDLLNESIEKFRTSIENAEKEIGNFEYVINKNKYWISVAERLIDDFKNLSSTEGEQFLNYKKKWIYII